MGPWVAGPNPLEEDMSTFAEDMDAVEALLDRELSGLDIAMLVQMRDAGKDVPTIAAIIGKEPPKANPRTKRYEGVGNTGTVVDITDMPIPDDIPSPTE